MELVAFLEQCGLTKKGRIDFDAVSEVTGHSRDSVKSMLAPSKEIPRWLKIIDKFEVGVLYSPDDLPMHKIVKNRTKNWSVYVFLIDEYGDPTTGYYNYTDKEWYFVEGGKIEELDFKWFYVPSWVTY